MKLKATRNVRVGKTLHMAGATIDCNEKEAAFLVAIGKAEPVAAEKAEKKGGV